MKQRIAVVGLKGLPPFGGTANGGENVIKNLHEKYDFTVFSISSHTNLKTGTYRDICYQIVLKSIPFAKLNSLLYYIRVAFILMFNKKYDIVHWHHRDAAFLVPLLRLRYKVLLTTHGITGNARKWRRYKWFLQMQLRFFVKYANIVTCVAKNERRVLKKKYDIDAVFIPNGINEIKDSDLKLTDKIVKPYITFAAGRIIEFKGLDVLLEALSSLGNPIHLKVIGDLSHEPDYKRKITVLAEKLDVEFIDLIKNKMDLFSIIKNSLFFVFPSRQEALSNMLLEVASIRTPLIVSNITENQDVFDDSEVEFFDSGDSDSLKKAIEFAFNNPGKLKQKVNNAYAKLTKQYLWTNSANKYAEQYDKLSD